MALALPFLDLPCTAAEIDQLLQSDTKHNVEHEMSLKDLYVQLVLVRRESFDR